MPAGPGDGFFGFAPAHPPLSSSGGSSSPVGGREVLAAGASHAGAGALACPTHASANDDGLPVGMV